MEEKQSGPILFYGGEIALMSPATGEGVMNGRKHQQRMSAGAVSAVTPARTWRRIKTTA
jgi:hypothetical protein